MSIVTQKINQDPCLTKYLVGLEIFKSSPITIIDIGSRGGFEKRWDIYNTQAKIIGFEPDTNECERLNKSAKLNTVHHPVALSRRKCRRTFYIAEHSAASGFYRPYTRYLSRLPEMANREIKDTIITNTIDLDSFLSENGISAVDFIKIDTEGSEMDIVLGAQRILKSSVLGLSLELMFNKQREGEPLFSEADLILRSLGFELYDLPVFRSARRVLSPHMFSDNAGPTNKGQITWTQAVYFRDGFDEIKFGDLIEKWDPIRILKMASLFELFNLEDCALELLDLCRTALSEAGFDPATLIDMLVPLVDGRSVSWGEYCTYVKAEGPPKYIEGRRVSKKEYEKYLKNK